MQNTKAAAAAAKKQKLKGCSALCCSCRLSVSSSSEEAESSNSDRYPTISSLTHAMVQERLDKMIREREEAKNEERRRRRAELEEKTKFIVMIAMEKSSNDPREDFRESIERMIMANRIHDTKDLRRLLNYYVSMNAEEYHSVILEVFHGVCSNFFLSCKQPLYQV
ncbi:probable transcription repressor OFP9 [Lycium barbarum]|uniref:probable transcription repressor OFP9 n=1 Tax=Lycium barbarum TaxID=112863 RepID=UPI00293EC0F8|nr:probable transcription repressor OFP9 [Lycium barbarum]